MMVTPNEAEELTEEDIKLQRIDELYSHIKNSV